MTLPNSQPAIPEAAIEVLVADLVQECERAIKQHEAALLDPSKRREDVHTKHILFIVRKHLAALPRLSIPSAPAPAPAPGELVELVKRLRWRASMGGDYGQRERKLDTDAAAAIAALTAANDRIAELERERDERQIWFEQACKDHSITWAEHDRQRDRAEAAEAELARLQSVQPAGHRPESEEVVAVKPLEWRLRALHPYTDRK